MSRKLSIKADAVYYSQLEQGARYLAAETSCAAERYGHLGMADLYARLAEEMRTETSI